MKDVAAAYKTSSPRSRRSQHSRQALQEEKHEQIFDAALPSRNVCMVFREALVELPFRIAGPPLKITFFKERDHDPFNRRYQSNDLERLKSPPRNLQLNAVCSGKRVAAPSKQCSLLTLCLFSLSVKVRQRRHHPRRNL